MPTLPTAFAAALPYRPGEGESLCICRSGRVLLSLVGGEARPGEPWSPGTLVPVFSATKALSAACVLLALAERGLDPAIEVGELWPAFPAPRCSVAQLLSHQAGLAAWDSPASLYDTEACRAAIESTRPAWAPPQHGYHPHTLGPILDILMLRLTGSRLGAFWEARVRRPLGLEAYIGLPESAQPRVAQLLPPRVQGAMPRSPFYRAYFDPSSAVYRAFHSVSGISSIREMNTLRALRCACPARGGVASARGLAMAYQAILGALPGSPFPACVTRWLSEPCCSGRDLTLLRDTSFTCGAMCRPAEFFGRGGFGHAGAGGSLAFAEPGSGYSFAYVMNRMQLGVLPGERVLSLVRAFERSYPCS